MTDTRPLQPIERALVAAAAAFCAVPASGYHPTDQSLIWRLAEITDAIQARSLADQLVITTGPVEYIYGDAKDLVEAHRHKIADPYAVRNHSRYLACHVFSYFEKRSIRELRSLGLPDYVPQPPNTVTVF